MSRLRTVFAAIALLVMTALPASAADLSPSATASKATPHCVGAALPEGVPASRPPVTVCFPTFAQAIAHATRGAVALPASATPASFTEQMAMASSTTTIDPRVA
jgi:hypothetical protein